MPELELNYPTITGPANVQYTCQVDGFAYGVDVPESSSSTDYTNEAAKSLCEVINLTLELEGVGAYAPRESYAPSQAELDKLRFEKRAIDHERLSAEFGAWNLGRIRSGECTPGEIDEWLESTEISKILAQLRRYSFELAISSIEALPLVGPTTTEFKAVWTAKLEAVL